MCQELPTPDPPPTHTHTHNLFIITIWCLLGPGSLKRRLDSPVNYLNQAV